jgi:putative peptidoglycan lipid II flippase
MGASSLVAIGILASRLTGLVRERVIGHFFGVESFVADAFRASIRIPNLLNNLFGEGVLSASFVTVYAKLRAVGEDKEAEDLAAAVFAVLALVCALLVLLGVMLTPFLIDLIAPGFHGKERALTIRLVRILFPGTGLLVMSAWCLGVLNSHRRFLLSYLAPVVSNVTVVAITIFFGQYMILDRLVVNVAWAVVLGSALMFLVQLPKVLEFLPAFRPRLDVRSKHVRRVLRNFGPIFLSRGVVQISSYVDQMIASWLPLGAVAAMGYGQVIATLPISLFSMSVSAAELPALSSATGSAEEVTLYLRTRLTAGLRRIAFFIIPSAAAFLGLGDVLAAMLYQSGRFQHADAVYVWAILAGSAVGLLASSLGRLYSSTFYALQNPRTPLRFALIRVTLTIGLGLLFAFPLPGWLGIEQRWGVAGLTASAGIAGWVEFALLRNSLAKLIGPTPLKASFTGRLWAVSFLGVVCAFSIKSVFGDMVAEHPIAAGCVLLPLYGAIYFGGTAYLGVAESRATLEKVTRRLLR